MLDAMFQILLIALCVSTATNWLRRRLISPQDMAKMVESRNFKKMLYDAQKKGDQKMLQKLIKKREYYQKIDAEIGKKNMMFLFGSLGIFYAVYIALTPLYHALDTIATLPGDLIIPLISQGNKLTFIGWFILCLLAVNMPLGKIFEIKPSEEVVNHAQKDASNQK